MSDQTIVEGEIVENETKKRRFPKLKRPSKNTLKVIGATAAATAGAIFVVQKSGGKTLDIDVSLPDIVPTDESND